MTANTGNPHDKAHELAGAISASEVYQNYCAAKKEVETNPDWKEKILNLRKRQMQLNRAQILGEEMPEASINEVTLEFAKMNQVKEIAHFFDAEGQFIQMFNDIQEIIKQTIERGFEE